MAVPGEDVLHAPVRQGGSQAAVPVDAQAPVGEARNQVMLQHAEMGHGDKILAVLPRRENLGLDPGEQFGGNKAVVRAVYAAVDGEQAVIAVQLGGVGGVALTADQGPVVAERGVNLQEIAKVEVIRGGDGADVVVAGA